MRFDTRDAAEDAIIAGRCGRIGSSQVFEVVRCAGETFYRVAVYDVRSVNPFQIEFNRYVRESTT